MSKSHQSSLLALQGMSQIADPINTDALFHCDISANDAVASVQPIDETIIDDSCIMYLDMSNINSTGSHIVDKSRYGNHVSINGASVSNGMNNKALQLDGTNDYLKTTTKITIESSMTWEVWINSGTVSMNQFILDCRDSEVGVQPLYISSTGAIQLYNSTGGSLNSPADIYKFDGNWHHIVCVGDITGRKIYYDNILVASDSVVFASHTPKTVTIGARHTFSSYFQGIIGSIVVYNRALSPLEIEVRYNKSIYTLRTDGKYGSAVAIEEATTNHILTAYNGETSSPWSRDGALVTIIQSNEEALFGKYCAKWHNTETGNGNCYINGPKFTTTTSAEWTFSCYLKRADGQPIISVGNVYMYVDGNSNADSPPSGIQDCGNGWYRVWRTRKDIVAGYVTLVGFSALSGETDWYLDGWQLESKPFPTSFTDTKRESGRLTYSLVPDGNKTISLWYSYNGVTTNSDRYLFSYDNFDDSDNIFALYLTRDNQWRLVSGNSYLNISELLINNTLSTGWHNFVVTKTNTNIILYIDGINMGSIVNPYLPIGITYLRIGNGANMNLVANGSAETGNNTNFSELSYDVSDSSNGDGKCFSVTSARTAKFSDNYIPIDPNKKYILSAYIKAGVISSLFYMGIYTCDKDKNFISNPMQFHYVNTETTLAVDLVNGATTVQLTNAINWANPTPGSIDANKQIALWPSTWTYPKYTYTRTLAYYTDITANVLTLQNPWSGGTILSGTPVANTTDSGTYQYCTATNILTPIEWTQYQSPILSGETINSSDGPTFRYGTRYIKVMFLLNRDFGTTTTFIDNVVFKEVNDTSSANGLVDELRIDNIARTQKEILTWYLSESPFLPVGNEKIVL